jgi:hypothetical protein
VAAYARVTSIGVSSTLKAKTCAPPSYPVLPAANEAFTGAGTPTGIRAGPDVIDGPVVAQAALTRAMISVAEASDRQRMARRKMGPR